MAKRIEPLKNMRPGRNEEPDLIEDDLDEEMLEPGGQADSSLNGDEEDEAAAEQERSALAVEEPDAAALREAAREAEELEREAERLAAAAVASSDYYSTDPVADYLRQIGRTRLLTQKEERELAERKDSGDEEAKQRLIEANLRLVVSVARRYSQSSGG